MLGRRIGKPQANKPLSYPRRVAPTTVLETLGGTETRCHTGESSFGRSQDIITMAIDNVLRMMSSCRFVSLQPLIITVLL